MIRMQGEEDGARVRAGAENAPTQVHFCASPFTVLMEDLDAEVPWWSLGDNRVEK